MQNGEIYNYRELRAELERTGATLPHRTATPRSSSHLYEERGPLFAEASARDVRDRDLGRERERASSWPATASGSSRSTTALTGDSLSFASELKALMRQPGFSREIDPDALEAFLAFSFVPAPLSIFRDVRKLPPGQRARLARTGELGRHDRALRKTAPRLRRASSGPKARTSWPRSCASGCATRFART